MDYLRVCAIDAGTRNFAWCVVDNTYWREPLVWRKEDLWAPKPQRRSVPTKEDIIVITMEWIAANRDALNDCDLIVLEKQMRTPFIITNTVINTCFYGKTVQVHPMTIGAYWKLPKTRARKKPAGVEVVSRHAVIPRTAKPDDLADTWMMAVYYLISKGAISASQL